MGKGLNSIKKEEKCALLSVECVDGVQYTRIVKNRSEIIEFDVDPTFVKSKMSLKGCYEVTEVQRCQVKPPLDIHKDEYLCLVNVSGRSLQLTCSLGKTPRRRLMPNDLFCKDGVIKSGWKLPFQTNTVVKECSVGWNCELHIAR